MRYDQYTKDQIKRRVARLLHRTNLSNPFPVEQLSSVPFETGGSDQAERAMASAYWSLLPPEQAQALATVRDMPCVDDTIYSLMDKTTHTGVFTPEGPILFDFPYNVVGVPCSIYTNDRAARGDLGEPMQMDPEHSLLDDILAWRARSQDLFDRQSRAFNLVRDLSECINTPGQWARVLPEIAPALDDASRERLRDLTKTSPWPKSLSKEYVSEQRQNFAELMALGTLMPINQFIIAHVGDVRTRT